MASEEDLDKLLGKLLEHLSKRLAEAKDDDPLPDPAAEPPEAPELTPQEKVQRNAEEKQHARQQRLEARGYDIGSDNTQRKERLGKSASQQLWDDKMEQRRKQLAAAEDPAKKAPEAPKMPKADPPPVAAPPPPGEPPDVEHPVPKARGDEEPPVDMGEDNFNRSQDVLDVAEQWSQAANATHDRLIKLLNDMLMTEINNLTRIQRLEALLARYGEY